MTRYGRSPWIDQIPRSRVPSFPKQRGRVETDVVIVGGGLTGCATAYTFSAASVNVLLLEADQIGRGAAGASGGWIADDPGSYFLNLERTLGVRAARRAWPLWHRAGLDFVSLLRRLNVKCALEPCSSVLAAMNPDQAARLKREVKARRDAGLEAPLLTPRVIAAEVALPSQGGIRSRDGATIDPYRAALGLAAAAAQRGARFFERSPVTRIGFSRKTVDIFTGGGGVIRAKRVVIATGAPTPLFKALRRHFWFRNRYFALTAPIPAKVRRQLGRGESVVRDLAEPPHMVRWVGGDRLLVAGADSEAPPDRLRERVLVQRTGQLMYELSTLYPDISGIAPDYGWSAPYALTAEGLPYVGPHRNYPHHLFAFGDASHGVTGAYLASRIMLRHHLGEVDPADEAFGFRL